MRKTNCSFKKKVYGVVNDEAGIKLVSKSYES